MSQLSTAIVTDTWVKGTWDEYLQVIAELDSEKAPCYYYNKHYKIEMTPISFDHSCDHSIIMLAVSLYTISQQIALRSLVTCSYRKTGVREAQPDASYYIGEQANAVPYGTSIIDLEHYPPPNLVIEISKATLADDLGKKRLLYEELGVSEYWVVDVQNTQVIAFKIYEGGSQRINTSLVLPGLKISILNEALQRTRQNNHSVVGQWLMQQFQ